MALTNNYKIYAASASNERLLDETTYSSNTDRANGAVPNTAISSRLMNTVLKSVTSFIYATIEALKSSSEYSGTSEIKSTSSANDMMTILSSIIQNLSVNSAYKLTNNVTFNIKGNGGSTLGTVSSNFQSGGTVNLTLGNTLDFGSSTVITAKKFVGEVQGDVTGNASTATNLKWWDDSWTNISLGASGFNLTSLLFAPGTYQFKFSYRNSTDNITHDITFPFVDVEGPGEQTVKMYAESMDGTHKFYLELSVTFDQDNHVDDNSIAVYFSNTMASYVYSKVTSSTTPDGSLAILTKLQYKRVK